MNGFLFIVLLVFLCIVVFVIKNTVWIRIRNWWLRIILQPPHFNESTKHYVRIITKTPDSKEEFIYETGKTGKGSGELQVPISDGKKEVYSVAVDKNDDDNFYLTLRKEGSNNPITLSLNSIYDLKKDGRILLIYTNIKVYGIKK